MIFASLVVLSYNRQEMLQRSLESLMANTHYPYELIVMDDASDAPTQEYLFKLLRQRRVSTVCLNSTWNMGLGIQFNRGAAIASGKYLCKLDADLLYAPGWLREVTQVLDHNENLGCFGLFKYFHEPCHFDREHPKDRKDHFEVDDFVGSALCMRREIYDRFGPWVEDPNANFAEDVRFKKAVLAGGYHLGLPLTELAENFGFGEHLTSLIRVIDWEGGRHEYNVPLMEPMVFNA